MKIKNVIPEILTVAATFGVIATAISVAKETPKALQILEKEEQKAGSLEAKEKIAVIAPAYKVSTALGGITIGCMLASNFIGRKRGAAIAGAYALTAASYSKYKYKIKELINSNLHDTALSNASIENYQKNLPKKTDPKKILFLDEYSGRFFESTMLEVFDAKYELNKRFSVNGYVSLNEWYDLVGLDKTDYGSLVGWDIESSVAQFGGYSWIDIDLTPVPSSKENSKEYYIVSFPYTPSDTWVDY